MGVQTIVDAQPYRQAAVMKTGYYTIMPGSGAVEIVNEKDLLRTCMGHDIGRRHHVDNE